MKIYDAVINIGSNSVKLLAPSLSELNFRLSVTSQLSDGEKEGKLAVEAIERTVDAVEDLYKKALEFNPRTIYLYATEAVRSADNRGALLNEIERRTGLTADVIDGESEAVFSFLGAQAEFEKFDALADVGGASTEIVIARQGSPELCNSIPVGAVRLENRFSQDYGALKDFALKQFERFKEFSCPHLVGTGGTFSTIAIAALKLKSYQVERVHGFTLSTGELAALTRTLTALSPQEFTDIYPFVNRRRALVLKAGLAIVNAAAETIKAEKLTVSLSDGLNGYLIYKNK